MKTLLRISIVLLCAATALAGQSQHIIPGEVPEGITAEDWGIVQEAYLKASNTDEHDFFGDAVAISGNTIVISAGDEDNSATGVNGNQSDNSASGSGAAYVFVRSGTMWSQQAYLKASNTDAGDRFGRSVAISGDTIVIGASNEDSNASGVNGNQADNSAPSAGAVYVFIRSGTTWTQQAYLKASNTDASDSFGESVSISGDTIVVGSPNEDSSATGVNGNQADNSAEGAGAAYVFVRNGSTWSQQAYLKASNTDGFRLYGLSVSISGDTIVVGSNTENSNATGVNGDQTDNSSKGAGAAYVFVRNSTSWSQQAYLKASNTEAYDYFGWSVAISGETIIVGSPGEDSSSAGVNGNQADNSAPSAGAVYVFIRSGTAWSQQAYLKASNADASDSFGESVSISEDTIVVGVEDENSNATGVNGDQADNSASSAGAAYAFVRNGTAWSQQAYLKASNTEAYDRFGQSVSTSGGTIVVGSRDGSNATGVNGDQDDNSAFQAGAAYVFTGIATEGSAIITDCSTVPAGIRIEWIPVSGWDSVVKCSTDLVNTPFTDLSATLPYPVNSYTDTVSQGECFYRVDLQP